jgi:hypothetical protein
MSAQPSATDKQVTAAIEVRRLSENEPLRFDVVVREDATATRHEVTFSPADRARLTDGRLTPEQVIEAAFRFLLDREPKEAILSRFDVNVISRYFPDFERALPGYLQNSDADHRS